MPIGAIASAIAREVGANPEPVACDVESARADYGDSVTGYALDQQMSGQKAMRQLGWSPQHLDVFADIRG